MTPYSYERRVVTTYIRNIGAELPSLDGRGKEGKKEREENYKKNYSVLCMK